MGEVSWRPTPTRSITAMCFSMQSFLNAATELRALDDVPAEIVAHLQAGGWPPLKSSCKRARSPAHGEIFDLEFSSPPSERLAPLGAHGGDTRHAVLHVIGSQIGTCPIFGADAPASAALAKRALALAADAGLAVPRVWLTGELARRGALRRLSYMLLEAMPSANVVAGLSLALPSELVATGAHTTGLARFDTAQTLVGELRRLAVSAGAMELDAPLAKLADACSSKWKIEPTPPRLILSPGGTKAEAGTKVEAADAGAAALDSGASWATAVVGDERLIDERAEPWDLLRAACHVVKARWLIDVLRRTPGQAPACELDEILVAHDEGQALLAERGWLPATVVSPGSSCAKLAQTFPEEMCPCY